MQQWTLFHHQTHPQLNVVSALAQPTSFFLELLVIALHSSPVAYWIPSDLRGSTSGVVKNVLDTINEIRTHNETLITIAGAGGNRDAAKRPEMAAVAVEKSDRLILTSDNPRFEEPEEIIRQMRAGVGGEYYNKVLSITDRREAIRTAVALAKKGDIILVAGKGHEDYQDVKGVKHHFDDVEELTKAFNEK